jgi:phosphinothricin acetyltransferase
VLNTVATFETEPYTPEHRREWFGHYAPRGRHQLLVAEHDDRVIGYVSTSPFHARPAYGTTVETSIYLHPDHTGRGYARPMYEALFGAIAGEDVHRAMAVIALPNGASVALHRKLGFEPVGVASEVGFKHGRFIDVGWYCKAL